MAQVMQKIADMSTDDYLKLVDQDDPDLQSRIKMLELANEIFLNEKKLSALDEKQRSLFLGDTFKPSKLYDDFDVNLFGSPGGSGYVHSMILSKYAYLDEFFAAIPRTGHIDKATYEQLVELFKQAIANAGIKIKPFAFFTRILTVARPDTFISAAANKPEAISKELGLKKLNNSFEKYWSSFLPKLHQMKPFKDGIGNPENYFLALLDGINLNNPLGMEKYQPT